MDPLPGEIHRWLIEARERLGRGLDEWLLSFEDSCAEQEQQAHASF